MNAESADLGDKKELIRNNMTHCHLVNGEELEAPNSLFVLKNRINVSITFIYRP